MKKTRRFRLQDLGWLLLAGMFGGCAAIGVTIAILAVITSGEAKSPPGYVNPSVAVGSSLGTVYKAAAIFGLSATAGAAAYTVGRSLR